MWRRTGIACLLGFGLLAVGVAPARAAALSPDGQALKSACSGPIQRLIAGAPASDQADALAELDGVITDMVAASRAEVADGRRQAAEHTETPELSALVVCLVDHRLAQLDGTAPPAGGGPGAGGPAMSAFASGGSSDGGSDDAGSAEGERPSCKLDMGDASTGVLSTESARLTNHCPVAVGYAYCVTSENGGGSFSCDRQRFGSGWISAGGSDGISMALASSPFEVHWGYCLARPGDDHPIASSPYWNGKQVNVICH